MENLMEKYGEVSNIASPEDFMTLADLKEFHEGAVDYIGETTVAADEMHATLTDELSDLDASTGFREKRLGGLFGDKTAANNLKTAKANLEQVETIQTNLGETEETLTGEVLDRAADIIADGDSEFANILDHRNLMNEACDFTEEVLREVQEAIDALNDAEEAEEWDQMTSSGFADMNSDIANEEAADEVADVTNILGEYRTFLHSIGENSAAQLEGADFDFDWGDMLSDDFFGDFWGSEMMLDKINDAQNDMIDLHDKISQLFESFVLDFNAVDVQINERVDEEWETA